MNILIGIRDQEENYKSIHNQELQWNSQSSSSNYMGNNNLLCNKF